MRVSVKHATDDGKVIIWTSIDAVCIRHGLLWLSTKSVPSDSISSRIIYLVVWMTKHSNGHKMKTDSNRRCIYQSHI